jgi:hypothetical protein
MNLKPVSLAAAVVLMTAAGCARNQTPQPPSPETPNPQEMPTPSTNPGTPDPNEKPTPPSTTPAPQPPPASSPNQ